MSFLTPSITAFVKKHANEDVRKLAFCKSDLTGDELKEALRQIEGRQKAKHKLPAWASNEDIVFPVQLSMEQCSSELTADYKKKIAGKGLLMADLTGGFGVDFAHIAQNFSEAQYVERNQELCQIARENFKVLGLTQAEIHNCDAEQFLTSTNKHFDLIFIDPARRDENGRKTVAPSDCLPDLTQMQGILSEKASKVMVKYSPMLDINTALKELKNITTIYTISVNNECKELLLIQDFTTGKTEDVKVVCVDLKQGKTDEFTFLLENEKQISTPLATSIGSYIYEPNSSIMKAGAYKSIAKAWNISPLHANSHIYTSDELVKEVQGRAFEVLGTCKINKDDFNRTFNGIKQANISVRNCPLKPEDIRKKLKLKEGGDFYLFATTLSNNDMVLIGGRKPNV